LFLSAFSVYAQSLGNVVLFSQEGERFFIILNGVRQNDEVQTNVKVTDLNAPMYKLIYL